MHFQWAFFYSTCPRSKKHPFSIFKVFSKSTKVTNSESPRDAVDGLVGSYSNSSWWNSSVMRIFTVSENSQSWHSKSMNRKGRIRRQKRTKDARESSSGWSQLGFPEDARWVSTRAVAKDHLHASLNCPGWFPYTCFQFRVIYIT